MYHVTCTMHNAQCTHRLNLFNSFDCQGQTSAFLNEKRTRVEASEVFQVIVVVAEVVGAT